MNPIFWLALIVFALGLGAAGGFLFHRYLHSTNHCNGCR